MNQDQDALLLLMRDDFQLFVEKVFEELHPGKLLEPNWHIDALCAQAMAIQRGDDRRVVIALPPRSLKSLIFSIALPAFLLARDPRLQILGASYDGALARQLSADCRKVMTASWYRPPFTNTQLSPTKSTEEHFETTANGCRRAVSALGSVTGFGADYIIVDDITSASDARKVDLHQERTEWFHSALLTRLNRPKEGAVVFVGQRLHSEDTMGAIAASEGFKTLSIPAIAPERKQYRLSDGTVHIRQPNDILQPILMDEAELRDRERRMRPGDFAAQYQQEPIPDGGGALRWDALKQFDQPPKDLTIFHSWDVARTPNGGDYTVGMKFGYRDERYYLLDIYRRQLDINGVVALIRARIFADKPLAVVIETADGSGDAACRILSRENIARFIRYSPSNSKEDRFYEIVPIIEAGDLFIPSQAPWLAEFRREFLSFPGGKSSRVHDDQLDALSQFLRNARRLVNAAGEPPPKKYFSPPVYRLARLAND